MDKILTPFLVPAVFIAAITLIVQGVFGIINTILQIRTVKLNRNANYISYVLSMLQLIDGVPVTEGIKISKKIEIMKKYLPNGFPEPLKDMIENQLGIESK